MLLARAPVRVSLAGGGTDLESYYSRFSGMVVSSAIDKYFYAFITPSDGDGVQISSSDYRAFYRWSQEEKPIWDGDLRLPRAILHEFGINEGFSIFLASEIPPATGLGSSSAVSVALVKALSTLRGYRLTPAQVAEMAAYLEIEKLGGVGGKQDQYAAAFGGLNAIYFERDGVTVERLALSASVRERLESRLLLFFSGASRTANEILRQQRRSMDRSDQEVLSALHGIKASAEEVRKALLAGGLREVGEIMHESWQLKKRLSRSVSNPRIDEIYERARVAGAVGGKMTGAGGGGFLLLYCEPENQPALRAEMTSLGLYQMDFHFDAGGAKVLVNSSTLMPEARGLSLSRGVPRCPRVLAH